MKTSGPSYVRSEQVEMTVSDLLRDPQAAFGRAQNGQERFALMEGGKPVAGLVSLDDLEFLRRTRGAQPTSETFPGPPKYEDWVVLACEIAVDLPTGDPFWGVSLLALLKEKHGGHSEWSAALLIAEKEVFIKNQLAATSEQDRVFNMRYTQLIEYWLLTYVRPIVRKT